MLFQMFFSFRFEFVATDLKGSAVVSASIQREVSSSFTFYLLLLLLFLNQFLVVAFSVGWLGNSFELFVA